MAATSKIILRTVRAKSNSKFPVKLQITFERFPKLYGLGIDMTKDEFDVYHSSKKLKSFFETIKHYQKKADDAIDSLKDGFSWSGFEKLFLGKVEETIKNNDNVLEAFLNYQKILIHEERFQSAGTYKSAYKTLKGYLETLIEFKGSEQLSFKDITPDFLKGFDKYMRLKELSTSTVGVYMRNLRAIYNQAIESKVVQAEFYPFGKNKYSSPASRKTKKSLTIEDIGKIYSYKAESEAEEWAKDMWMFAYFANGLNIKDLALLRYKNIVSDEIEFLRSKTKNSTAEQEKKITVTITNEMKAIITKWGNKKGNPNDYIFNILSKDNDSAKRIYMNVNQAIKTINKQVKSIADKLKLERLPTTNFARHSYATVLKRAGVPTEMISEQLGHSSIKTTEIYLGSFEKEQRREVVKYLTAFNKIESVE